MAVLDYIIGNTDRHLRNYRTGRHGEIVAIDNALTFPEAPDPRMGIRSDFAVEFHNVELSEEVLGSVRALEVGQLRTMLYDGGLSEKAVEGACARLVEIQNHGKITGKAWEPGVLRDGITHGFLPETKGLPEGWLTPWFTAPDNGKPYGS